MFNPVGVEEEYNSISRQAEPRHPENPEPRHPGTPKHRGPVASLSGI